MPPLKVKREGRAAIWVGQGSLDFPQKLINLLGGCPLELPLLEVPKRETKETLSLQREIHAERATKVWKSGPKIVVGNLQYAKLSSSTLGDSNRPSIKTDKTSHKQSQPDLSELSFCTGHQPKASNFRILSGHQAPTPLLKLV